MVRDFTEIAGTWVSMVVLEEFVCCGEGYGRPVLESEMRRVN